MYRLSWPEHYYRETSLSITSSIHFPRIEQLRSANIFTNLDLRRAYNLILKRKGDEWENTVQHHLNHFYMYHVMPYGLSGAPFCFPMFYK